ncbi:hypothetical protein [Mycolicibacterium neoaurum]|uniref:hypothetical protein n=1 Tax=Mycolicibacterium neoaurum TaxID=1795 RepID=UPI001F4CF1C2|nr:hypothetical protein [Mycolicibacterium neoaurum]
MSNDFWSISGYVFTVLGAVLGVTLGVAGLYYGRLQARRADTEHQRRQDVLRWVIDRANYVKFEHEIFDELTAFNGHDPLLGRWLWLLHQAGCDLYLTAVDQFLAGEATFTYADLSRIADTQLVGGSWQYRYWVSKIALRPENRESDPPDLPSAFDKHRVTRHFDLRETSRRSNSFSWSKSRRLRRWRR